MKQKRTHRAKKVAKKRRVWSDGTAGGSQLATFDGSLAWLKPSAIVIAIAAVLVLAMLLLVRELPLIETYVSEVFLGHRNANREATISPAAIESSSALAADETPRPQSGRNVARENLQVTVVGGYVNIVNEGEIPIHLTRVVQNKRYRMAWCDTNANVNTHLNQPPDFSHRVDQVLQIGDGYKSASDSACGSIAVVELYTDQGDATFRLSP